MSEDARAWLVFIAILVVPYIDEVFITSKVKEAELASKVQCHDFPDKCWIQFKKRM